MTESKKRRVRLSEFKAKVGLEALGGINTINLFNKDQGSQFTSKTFIGVLKREDIAISMDSRGRAYDNIFVEQLWRSVKH